MQGAVDAEFGLEASLDGRTYDKICPEDPIRIPLGISPIFRPIMGYLKGLEAIIRIFDHSTYPNFLEK